MVRKKSIPTRIKQSLHTSLPYCSAVMNVSASKLQETNQHHSSSSSQNRSIEEYYIQGEDDERTLLSFLKPSSVADMYAKLEREEKLERAKALKNGALTDFIQKRTKARQVKPNGFKRRQAHSADQKIISSNEEEKQAESVMDKKFETWADSIVLGDILSESVLIKLRQFQLDMSQSTPLIDETLDLPPTSNIVSAAAIVASTAVSVVPLDTHEAKIESNENKEVLLRGYTAPVSQFVPGLKFNVSRNAQGAETSSFTGVYFRKDIKKWQSHYSINRKRIGANFVSEMEAVLYRDRMLRLHHLTDQLLNFPTDDEIKSKWGVSKTSSIYRGVTWDKGAKKWRVQIRINGKSTSCGLFVSEIEAAKKYDRVVIENGLGTSLNFPVESMHEEVNLSTMRTEEEARRSVAELQEENDSKPFSSRRYCGLDSISASELQDLRDISESFTVKSSTRKAPKERNGDMSQVPPRTLKVRQKPSKTSDSLPLLPEPEPEIVQEDLSEYELLRLENIRRNRAFMDSLGLGVGCSEYLTSLAASEAKEEAEKQSSKNNAKSGGDGGDYSTAHTNKSEYEKLREGNIERNNSFMESIGLIPNCPPGTKAKAKANITASKKPFGATKSNKWTCHMCTFLNKERDAYCSICGTAWDPFFSPESSSSLSSSSEKISAAELKAAAVNFIQVPEGFELVDLNKTELYEGEQINLFELVPIRSKSKKSQEDDTDDNPCSSILQKKGSVKTSQLDHSHKTSDMFDSYEDWLAHKREVMNFAMVNIREIEIETTEVDGFEIQAAEEVW